MGRACAEASARVCAEATARACVKAITGTCAEAVAGACMEAIAGTCMGAIAGACMEAIAGACCQSLCGGSYRRSHMVRHGGQEVLCTYTKCGAHGNMMHATQWHMAPPYFDSFSLLAIPPPSIVFRAR